MSASTVHPLTQADVARWLQMRVKLWPAALDEHEPDAPHLLAGRCPTTGEPSQVFLLCDGEGEAVGFAEVTARGYVLNCEAPSAHVEGIYVEPSHRRQGASQALFDAIAAWAQARGCVALTTDLDAANHASQRAHERAGFVHVEDSRVMQRALDPGVIAAGPLTLEPLSHIHLSAMIAHWNEPAVRRYLWDDRWVTLAMARGALDNSAATHARHGVGLYAMTRGADPIGCVGVCTLVSPDMPELLVSLESALWGKGYATLAARAVMAHALQVARVEELWAAADADNARSLRLLDALGFERSVSVEIHGAALTYRRVGGSLR